MIGEAHNNRTDPVQRVRVMFLRRRVSSKYGLFCGRAQLRTSAPRVSCGAKRDLLGHSD
jgi:hypothetical protein